MRPEQLATWLWGAWLVSWMIAALFRSRAVARPVSGETPHRLVTMAGAVLLFVTRIGAGRLWPAVTGVEWALTGLIACGFAITWWARVTLGRLWSGDVVRKADHRVVDRGPYRLVRHPIYTGLTLSVIATAGLRASPIAIAGAALVTYGLYLKGRLEERFLRQELGEPYAEYARRTPMLVPFAKSSATSSAG